MSVAPTPGGRLLAPADHSAPWLRSNGYAGPAAGAVLGRWAMVLAITTFPYARPQGLGREIKNHSGWHQAAADRCSPCWW
jgi:hypothetical protein